MFCFAQPNQQKERRSEVISVTINERRVGDMDFKNVKTCELVEELKKREGICLIIGQNHMKIKK